MKIRADLFWGMKNIRHLCSDNFCQMVKGTGLTHLTKLWQKKRFSTGSGTCPIDPKDEKPYFLFSEKTLRLITPAFGFSHPRSTKTTLEFGSCDRRPTTITLGNRSCDRSKLTITAEKGSSHRRASMTTSVFIVFQSSCYEEFSGIPVDWLTTVDDFSGLPFVWSTRVDQRTRDY